MRVEDRFLKYVSYWTTSNDKNVTNDSVQIPSTDRQFELAKFLESELKNLGFENVTLTEHCYLYGMLPATPGYESQKSVGFISHMDTSPDFSGKDVNPQIIQNYNGEDILLTGSGAYLKVSDFPSLKNLTGRTVITTDGTTLLGADDKAGIAEIITAFEEIISSRQPHGELWVGFTPDEEIGCGADLFDLKHFTADFAYTIDGDYEGEIAYENFNAASVHFSIKGINVHPGEAKNIMVNAAFIACEIQSLLPQKDIPALTEGREGFFHITDIHGNVTSADLSYIVRDHDKRTFETRLNKMRTIEIEMNQKYGAGTVTLSITNSYSNMIEIMDQHPYVVNIAKKAIQNVGLDPISRPIRGGTDGARLSFMGLPCPNLGTGGYGFHGPYEHISIEGMETSVQIIKEIIKITAMQ